MNDGNGNNKKIISPIDDEEEHEFSIDEEEINAIDTIDAIDINETELNKDSDSNCEPIPSDENEQKLSSTGSSLSGNPRLIEPETPSERAFLHQLSQIALDETNVCQISFIL